MRLRNTRTRRRAASLVEAVIVLSVFFVLILVMIDLGLGILRYNLVSAAARHGARRTIVHGARGTELGVWGPATIGPISGSDPNPLAQEMRPFLSQLDPDQVAIQAEWLDGGNEFNQRVRVTVSLPYRPKLGFLMGNPELLLRASSTLPIAH